MLPDSSTEPSVHVTFMTIPSQTVSGIDRILTRRPNHVLTLHLRKIVTEPRNQPCTYKCHLNKLLERTTEPTVYVRILFEQIIRKNHGTNRICMNIIWTSY